MATWIETSCLLVPTFAIVVPATHACDYWEIWVMSGSQLFHAVFLEQSTRCVESAPCCLNPMWCSHSPEPVLSMATKWMEWRQILLASPHNFPFPGFAVSSAPNHPSKIAYFNQSDPLLPPDCPYFPFLPVSLCSLHLEHILVQNLLQIPGLPFSIPWLSKIVHKGLLHTYHWY